METLLIVLLMLIPLVVFHEFGHFIVAKLSGVKVSKFAFGFGTRLFGFEYKGTDYRFNLLPFGGYVDLIGDEAYDGTIPTDPKHFYNQPKWIRFLILVMGPLFNLLLALIIFFFIFLTRPIHKPVHIDDSAYVVGHVLSGSTEDKAGLQAGDKITALNGTPIQDPSQLQTELMLNPGNRVSLTLVRNGEERTIRFEVDADPIEGFGITHFDRATRLQVYRVQEDSPASRAGLKEGDIITHINDRPVYGSQEYNSLSAQINQASSFPIRMGILRDGEPLELAITPERSDKATLIWPILPMPFQQYVLAHHVLARGKWLIGIVPLPEYEEYPPSLGQAVAQSLDSFNTYSLLLFKAVKKLVIGSLPMKTLSGPLNVAKHAKQSLDRGWLFFFHMMAVLSIQLGILNLLPIPVLDGGEILVLAMEGVARRDFSFVTKMKIKMVGFVFLVGLMGVVLFMDAFKLYKGM